MFLTEMGEAKEWGWRLCVAGDLSGPGPLVLCIYVVFGHVLRPWASPCASPRLASTVLVMSWVDLMRLAYATGVAMRNRFPHWTFVALYPPQCLI